jgi:predicted DNA-binding transcriptional regulator YafY
MNRIDRLTGMILLLQSRRVITAEEIAEHFEMSVRTVYRDIAALSEAGVPIVAEAGVGYSLARGYHMPPVMFTEEEAAALVIGAEVTHQVADDSLKRSIGGALLKIRSVLPVDRRDYVNRLEKSVNVHFGRPNAPGADLMPLQEAVVRRRCVALRYDAARRGEVTERVVEPLGMVFYARQWHLIAWCRLRGGLRDFRLDRVESWKVLTETFTGHENFSMEAFLREHMDGPEMSPATIVVACELLDRFRSEAPSPPLREEKLPDGRVRVELQAYGPQYLANWLLSFGTRVQAESPPELVEAVRARAGEILRLYDSPNPS